MSPQKIDQRVDFLFRVAQDAPGSNRRTDGWQARLTAGLWVKNDLIAMGWNVAKSHPLQARFPRKKGYSFMHAEINTIRQALKRYSEKDLKRMKTTLIISRAKKEPSRSHRADDTQWVTGLARPCVGCWRAIQNFQINRVIWSEDGSNPMDGRSRWTIAEFHDFDRESSHCGCSIDQNHHH